MGYEYKEADLFDFVRVQHHAIQQKGNEVVFEKCPYCKGGKHSDKYTFAVNRENGAFNCKRNSCGQQGHFVQLARDFDYTLDYFEDKPLREYRKLKTVKPKPKPKAIQYLLGRGISEEVANRYHITTKNDNDNILVFPFYDENGDMVTVKYRNMNYVNKQSSGNKEWFETNTKPILFGMEQCTNFQRLVITEGQIDSLSLATAGIENATSVPTGARGTTWITHCWDWLIQFEEIVVFGDYEHGKVTLVTDIKHRLRGQCIIKTVQPKDYLGEKDANAILMKYGRSELVKAVENAQLAPVKHIKRLADVEDIDIYSLPRIQTNISRLDNIIGGIFFAQVILLTGERGDGKSTFMSQMIAETTEQGYRTLIYSGELPDYHFKRWIDLQIAGDRNTYETVDRAGFKSYTLTKEISNRITNWYQDQLFLYDNRSIDDEMDDLLDTVEETIQQYGVNLVCIDNLMTALDVDLSKDLYRAQSKFVKRLTIIAQKFNVTFILVAHPRKGTNGKNDDVSGSGDITNRVDVVLNYSRNNMDPDEPGYIDCDSFLSVTKNRLIGHTTKEKDRIKLWYNEPSKRIFELGGGKQAYGWERDDQGFTQEQIEATPFDEQ